jgi:hypothetical protein
VSAHKVAVPTPTPARAVVALIVQRSTIELFAAYGVAVAPTCVSSMQPVKKRPDHIVGTVLVSGPGRRGVLAISTSSATLMRMKPTAGDAPSVQDWMRELTNQLAGRIKNRFGRYKLVMQVSLPTALSSTVMDDLGNKSGLVYVFHTTKDEVRVTLTGGFEGASLVLQGEGAGAEEGDVILF